jgi:hypothetical protein
MLAHSGDKEGGLAHAQAALDRLPPERRSLSLRLMMDEVRRPDEGSSESDGAADEGRESYSGQGEPGQQA